MPLSYSTIIYTKIKDLRPILDHGMLLTHIPLSFPVTRLKVVSLFDEAPVSAVFRMTMEANFPSFDFDDFGTWIFNFL